MNNKNSIETPSLRFLQEEHEQFDNGSLGRGNERDMLVESEESIHESNFEERLRAKL